MSRAGVAATLAAAAVLLPALVWGRGPRAASPGVEVERMAAVLGARPEHPHLIGTAMFFARWFHPGGTKGLHLSLYRLPARSKAGDLDQCEDALASDGWSRLVKTVEAQGSEETLIYVRLHGAREFDMLIATVDGDAELTVVRLRADPKKLMATADTR